VPCCVPLAGSLTRLGGQDAIKYHKNRKWREKQRRLKRLKKEAKAKAHDDSS